MTEEEMKKLRQTVEYFGHWYDVIGEERIAILEKAVVELTEKDKQIEEFEAQTSKAKELLRDVLPNIDLTDCVNNDPRLLLYDKIKSLIKEKEK